MDCRTRKTLVAELLPAVAFWLLLTVLLIAAQALG
jgi:hypothetical protein